MTKNKIVLTPLIGLMSNRPTEEIEQHVIEEMEKHRRLRDEATALEVRLQQAEDHDVRAGVAHAYASAMIALHAQQTVVSTLLDILGYIPKVGKIKSH